jgi:predicted dehydrogenase
MCDTVESTARNIAEQFAIERYFTNFSEMLKMGLDVVDITTPPSTHFGLAVEAMESGCHVLAEKPLAMSVEDVDEMFRVSRRENVKLCVVHQNLFNPAVLKARRLVEAGFVGDLLGIDVATLVRKDNYMCVNGKHWCHTLPGGIFFEVLPHPVYLLQTFLRKFEAAFVFAKRLGGFGWMKADELRVLLNSEKSVGLLVASCNSPFHGDSIYISGSKMCLQVDLWGRSVIKYKPRTEDPVSVGKWNLSLASQSLGLLGSTFSNFLGMVVGGEKVSAHYGFLREFVRSIRSDGELPVSEGEARENVRIVCNICEKIDNSV